MLGHKLNVLIDTLADRTHIVSLEAEEFQSLSVLNEIAVGTVLSLRF